jgi:hypothetical protein
LAVAQSDASTMQLRTAALMASQAVVQLGGVIVHRALSLSQTCVQVTSLFWPLPLSLSLSLQAPTAEIIEASMSIFNILGLLYVGAQPSRSATRCPLEGIHGRRPRCGIVGGVSA